MPTIEETQIAEYYIFATANLFGVTIDQLKGRDRHRGIVDARFCAIDKVYIGTEMTYAEVGELFDNRTPGAIHNALKKSPLNNPLE